jgi:hypothetical protein
MELSPEFWAAIFGALFGYAARSAIQQWRDRKHDQQPRL